MLVEGDTSGLELVGVAYLSQDLIMCEEIRSSVNIHSNNQERFNLPTRLVAKTFVFRLIYGGNEYSYAYDPEFNWISDSQKFWLKVINEFYNKYKGIAEWHKKLMERAMLTSQWVSPTGRKYKYEPYRNRRGEWVWPRTKILNYPVQGLGADLMSIARVSACKRLSVYEEVLHVNTVHDSIILDTPEYLVYDVIPVLDQVFKDIPKNFEKLFGVPFNLPMHGEIKYGYNWKEMKKYES